MADLTADVLERLEAKDELLFDLSDTLDSKASIALVIVTFLATQSGVFLSNSGLNEQLRVLQIVAAFALAGAGGFAVAALWLRDHTTETAESLDEWLRQLRAHYSGATNAEDAVFIAFREGRIKRLKESIAANSEISRNKSSSS